MTERGRKRYVLVELGIFIVLTVLYLNLVPRSTPVDVSLALVGAIYVLASSRHTARHFWDKPILPKKERMKDAFRLASAFTFPTLGLFMIIGIWISYSASPSVDAAWARVFNVYFLKALPIYIAWAYVQQFLFQFHLLSRLKVLFSSFPLAVPVVVNGIFFGLVHIPDGWVLVVLTVAGGSVWTYIYLRYRVILPLALSHALLGAAYYQWIAGRSFLDSLVVIIYEGLPWAFMAF